MKQLANFLALFASFGTLICCAIPALLVALGMGATLAATVSTFPQLIWLSQHKNAVFVFAGSMLTLTFVLRRFSSQNACPADPELARACASTKRISSLVFGLSAGMFLIGGFFAFVAPYLIE